MGYRVLGIDPGLKLGWSIYDSTQKRVLESGVFQAKGPDCDSRLDAIARWVRDFLPEGNSLDAVFVESVGFACKSRQAARVLEVVSWEVRRRCKRLGLYCAEIVRSSAYLTVLGAGNGNADKQTMRTHVETKYMTKCSTMDEADACAIAIAGAEKLRRTE